MPNFTKLQNLLPAMQHQRASISGVSYDFMFFYWGLQGFIAFDIETEAKLKRHNGRRKTGSVGTRYRVDVPNGELYPNDINGTGKRYDALFSFIAMNDDDAIDKANAMFTKKFEKYRQAIIKKEP